ncbi:MAG: ABC transporter ATP-binding protein [Rickettsiales bacterium]|nr:ABC transporter ATP-binding protein [Rickettsiales bacterium]|tara:strand:- start:19 stop:732 length:714 start_codon:yes stop_codon:yes gene_type:complete
MSNIKINIRDLKKKFGDKDVLKDINLKIYESESLAIIGESGSGKSVLTKCITGLLDYNSGQIIFDNSYDLKKINKEEKIKHISKFGVLFQNAALFDSLTVKENISFSRQFSEKVEILQEVGIDDSILELFPSDISVSMQKRVGLARAILAQPEILVFDEPTTGLDPIMSDQINKLIRKLVTKNKLTTITITHDMESVYEFADKVAFINKGAINWYGDVNELDKTKNKVLINFINGET